MNLWCSSGFSELEQIVYWTRSCSFLSKKEKKTVSCFVVCILLLNSVVFWYITNVFGFVSVTLSLVTVEHRSSRNAIIMVTLASFTVYKDKV